MRQSVTIGPEFFKNTTRDYANWVQALIREFAQNGVDCGSRNLGFTIRTLEIEGQTHTELTVTNDGAPMTQEVLTTKLLALGGTTKTDGQNAGGFGVAKLLLYFMHRSYLIHTGKFLVTGSGASYDLVESETEFFGTKNVIVLVGDLQGRLVSALRRFVDLAQLGVRVLVSVELDGKLETVLDARPDLRKGSPRREFEFGTVYTNKHEKGLLVVRVNGLPMFTTDHDHDRTVIVELNQHSTKVLTSNRDGLVWQYQRELNQFVTQLSVDKRSALRPKADQYERYQGAKLGYQRAVEHESETGKVELAISDAALVGLIEKMVPTAHAGSVVGTRNALSQEFIIRNETDLAIPDYYKPGSKQFGTYARKLALIWGRLLVRLHELFELEESFAIGFVFGEVRALHQVHPDFGRVYYLNPAVLVESKHTKAWRKRLKLTDKGKLLSEAAHEFVHGCGFSGHCEDYAAKLTEVMEKVLDHKQSFNACFRV